MIYNIVYGDGIYHHDMLIEKEPESESDPEPNKFGWEEYALIGLAVVLFYMLATRG